MTATTAQETGLPEDLTHRPHVFIGGEWRASEDGTPVEVRTPWNGDLVGRATLGTPGDIDAAVTSARATFDAGVWRDVASGDRADVLARAADHLESRLAELSLLVTSELGCPLSYSQRVHVPGPIRVLRYYAEMARTFQYEDQRSDGVSTSLVRRVPVGVVGAVTPWNGPISNPMMKLAPSLANGCSVVLKPSPETPLSAYAIADALSEAGLPDGVLNIVPGGREVGEHLVAHPEVDKVAFTGSTAAGKRVMAACAERVARVTLELGGKSAAIVLPDADLDALVPTLLPMAFMLNGQACIAQTRVLVTEEREQELLDALAAAFTAQQVGDPLEQATDIGPLVSSAQRERVEGYVSLAATEGAQVVVGGRRPTFDSPLDHGWFVAPTLLAGVENSMRVAREEIFGPVVSVLRFRTADEAVEIANDSVYGLSGSVWSTDVDQALAVAKRVRTGMVSINGSPQAFGTPLGGFKQSGLGRELGPEGFTPYLEAQSIALGGGAR